MADKPTYVELENQIRELKKSEKYLKKAQAALRDSEEKYRKTFESITDSITITRIEDGLYLYVNDGFCHQTGYPREEVLGSTPAQMKLYVNPAERDRFIGILKKYGQAKDVVVRFRRKSGEIYYSEFSAKPITYEGQSCLLAQSRDITTRKKAEEALKTSHERFLMVLNSIDATIYVADMENGEILFMNKYMVESFGRDMTGEICWKAFRNESEKCSHCTNDKLIDAQGSPTGVYVWQDKNPVTGRWYMNHDRAIEWTNGRMVKIQIATDITDFIKMQEEFRQAQKMESVGRLAGGIAHDFNNMLSIILGNTEIILEDMNPVEPFVENLKEIYSAAERSGKLTRQLLAFARKQTIAPKTLDLNAILTEMIKMLQRLIGEDINLSWQPSKRLWPIRIDPSQVDQILANLCVNARDAIDGVGKVTIETNNKTIDYSYCKDHSEIIPGDFVMIAISDNGSGMDKKTLDNLFEPFFTTKGIGQGSGLGLSTVYGIVKQNGGFINVYSELDKGTTFKIYLPRHMETIISRQKKDLLKTDQTGLETILLVEDEKAILSMTKIMLERLGYMILAASSPSAAFRIIEDCRDTKIDLLITDVIMPEMNGRDLSKKLLNIYPNLKCLFMSGYTANVIAHHGVLDPGVQFINKPFSKHDLASKVREVLDNEPFSNA